jgi:hypothetical protein
MINKTKKNKQTNPKSEIRNMHELKNIFVLIAFYKIIFIFQTRKVYFKYYTKLMQNKMKITRGVLDYCSIFF